MRGLSLIGIVFALVLLAAPLRADDKAARERRVKVALALAASPSPPPGEGCGKCREDGPQAWEDALKDRKPLVLFVGGPCDGLGKAACEAGAVAVKVPEYAGSKEQRIVVGSPKADGSGFESVRTLPAKSAPSEVSAAVKLAEPKQSPPKIDWYFN